MDKVLAMTNFSGEGDIHNREFKTRKDALKWCMDYVGKLIYNPEKKTIYYDDDIQEGAVDFDLMRCKCVLFNDYGFCVDVINTETNKIEYEIMTIIIDPNEIK